MKKEKRKIIFVHDGLAYYPSMLASKRFFSSLGYIVEEKTRLELKEEKNFDNAVLWIMMGLYPFRPKGDFSAIIHEYRSQSIGKFCNVKDLIKRFFNHKPSYRIFQSNKIKDIFNKNDQVPFGILSLGVSKDILNYRTESKNYIYDFCYVGAVSNDRQIPNMLNSFIDAYGSNKSFLLVGDVRDNIDKNFSKYENISFTGRVSQTEVFKHINSSEFAVSFVPPYPPYCYQPPTKLYEYAALGKKIVVNESDSNLVELDKFKISAHVMKNGEFPDFHQLSLLCEDYEFDPSVIFFENFIIESGVNDFINNISFDD